MTEIELPFGPCDVRVTGSGMPILLVHGLLVNGGLWDRVVPSLAKSHQVIQPDLPLGAHRVAATNRTHVHPEGVADALVVLLDKLDVKQAVVFGSDTGGAVAQIMTARHPERVRALMLTSCDAFNHFPPTLFKPLKPLLAIPGAVDLIGLLYRSKRVRRSIVGAGLVLNKPIDDAMIKPFFDRLTSDRGVRRDMAQFLRACKPALTNQAAEQLRSFHKPALLAWSRRDPLFPESDGKRLAQTLPDCRLEWIDNSLAFSMLDQPDQLLAIVEPFLAGLLG